MITTVYKYNEETFETEAELLKHLETTFKNLGGIALGWRLNPLNINDWKNSCIFVFLPNKEVLQIFKDVAEYFDFSEQTINMDIGTYYYDKNPNGYCGYTSYRI